MKVAEAAMSSGMARIKINLEQYRDKLTSFSNPGTSYLK